MNTGQMFLPSQVSRCTAYGQVPQTGLGSVQELAEVSKSSGCALMFDTHQSLKFWLKVVASKNVARISVTLLTSQSPISWLKAVASANRPRIVVTLPTSQSPMF